MLVVCSKNIVVIVISYYNVFAVEDPVVCAGCCSIYMPLCSFQIFNPCNQFLFHVVVVNSMDLLFLL